MQSIEYRYMHDPMVHALVDYLEAAIYQLKFSPSEIREAAMLAAIRYEMHRPDRIARILEMGECSPQQAKVAPEGIEDNVK